MTTDRLRDLMEERVADAHADDFALRAWERADEVRRRRRYTVVGAVAASVLVVAGGLRALDGPDAGPLPASRTPSPTVTAETPEVRATLAGRFRDAPFWWAPPAANDAQLPVLQVPGLPEELSMAQAPYVDPPPDHVDAVIGLGKQQYVLLTDGALVTVDLSHRLGPVADEGGNAFSPLGPNSVSPDGTEVAFRQPGRLLVWDLPANSWRSVATLETERGPTAGVGPWDRGDHGYGYPVAGADGQSAELYWMAEGAAAPSASRPDQYGNPEFLAAGTPGNPDLLAFGEGRSKMCCIPAAWFSRDIVLFRTLSGRDWRVLAWRVGTPDVYRVSVLTDFPWSGTAFSWAEDAFR